MAYIQTHSIYNREGLPDIFEILSLSIRVKSVVETGTTPALALGP